MRLFNKKQLSPQHKAALQQVVEYSKGNYINIISIVAHGSVGISDTHPFSDVDAAIILATKKKTNQQEFLIYEDIVLSLMFYDLNSFLRTNLDNPFNGMMDRISIQKATVLYDPADCWKDIAHAALKTQNLCLLYSKIVNKLWTLCIIYLGKIITSVKNEDFMYAAECSTLLANNAAHIILIINNSTFIANRHLYKQAMQCPVKPKKFQEDLNGVLGIKNEISFEQRVFHGLNLCQELQKLLQTITEYKDIHTLLIPLARYERAVQKMLLKAQ